MAFSFLGKLFGSTKALEEVVGGLGRGIDALVYTDEERAGDAATARSEARSMVVKWMATTTGQNLARRLLAVMITLVWLSQYMASMGLNLIAIWVEQPDEWQESAVLVGGYAERMNGAMMLILAFYFAAPHMGPIVSSVLNRFGKTNGA